MHVHCKYTLYTYSEHAINRHAGLVYNNNNFRKFNYKTWFYCTNPNNCPVKKNVPNNHNKQQKCYAVRTDLRFYTFSTCSKKKIGGFHNIGTINMSELFIDNREECPCCSCLNCANLNIINDYETINKTSQYS